MQIPTLYVTAALLGAEEPEEAWEVVVSLPLEEQAAKAKTSVRARTRAIIFFMIEFLSLYSDNLLICSGFLIREILSAVAIVLFS